MRIGVLAARANISASRIRFYEAQGLLPRPARRPSGYRDYGEGALEIIAFINRARCLGFRLSEIAAHLGSPRDDERKMRLLSQVEAKLSELDAVLADLQDRRKALSDIATQLRQVAAHDR